LKEERLKEKEEQLRSKDEQIKAVEKQNELLKLLSAEMLLKNYSAMKTMFEDQIASLEIEKEEFKKKYEQANADLSAAQASGGAKAEEVDSLKKEIRYLEEQLRQKEIGINAVRRSQHDFQGMRLKDAYGPVGAWFLFFKSRATNAFKADLDKRDTDGKIKPLPANLSSYLGMLEEFEGKGPTYMRMEEAIQKIADKYKDDPKEFKKKIKELEAEAWEDFLDMTISQAILWAGTNIQEPGDKDDEEKNGKS
jgi:hypothetical protein